MQYSHLFILHKSRKVKLAPKGYHMLGWFRNTIFMGCYIVTNEELILLVTDEEITYLGYQVYQMHYNFSISRNTLCIISTIRSCIQSSFIYWWHYYVASYSALFQESLSVWPKITNNEHSYISLTNLIVDQHFIDTTW